MAFRAGTVAWSMLTGINTVGTNIQPYVDNFTWPQSVETLDVSAFGTSAKAFINGLTDGDTVSFSGPYDKVVYNLLTGLKAGQAAGSAASTVTWGPGGSVATEAKISGSAWVTSVGLSAGVGGRVEYSASIQITGAVVSTVW